jgi:hypothetical protein
MAKAGLVVLMAAGCLFLWIGLPLLWLVLTRHTEPDATRFVLVITGCALTMPIVGWGLYRLEGLYSGVSGTPARPARAGYLRSIGEERRSRRGLSLLDRMLVASALVALVALVAWWAFIADSPNPSGPLQPL